MIISRLILLRILNVSDNYCKGKQKTHFMFSKYRIIRNSLRDSRTLRYSSRDGHAEGEHVNRGRHIPSFCPTLKVLDILLSAVSVLVVAQSSLKVPEGLCELPGNFFFFFSMH
jgi:hypothetical protein